MKKRGIIEVHFNWIFILIAGALILIFFFSLINKQKEVSELKASSTIATNLHSILTGAEVSTQTVNIIDIPKIEINFGCMDYKVGSVKRNLRSTIIFAPSVIKGGKALTWALDWSLPYRVTNFLYVTDPQLRYIIVTNRQDPGSVLYSKLPDGLNKELINKDDYNKIKNKNNYKVKFIFFGNLNNIPKNIPQALQSMNDKDVTAIFLEDNANLEGYGTITFLRKNNTKWEEEGETAYIKIESLLGSIFIDNIKTYNCLMRKAFRKLNIVTKIYINRSEELENYYSNNLNIECSNVHSDAVNFLELMEQAAYERAKDFPTAAYTNMEAMMDYSKRIGGTQESANNRAQLYSCALIY